MQNIVVYGKGAKKEANVISYFLMTSEWHPCHIVLGYYTTGFPQRPENLENESGPGKVLDDEYLAKSRGILWSVMEFYQICH